MYKLLKLLLFIWIGIYIFEGVVRYILGFVGLSVLVYLKDMIMISIILLSLIHFVRKDQLSKAFLGLSFVLIYGLTRSIWLDINLIQALYGLNTYSTLIAGFLLAYCFLDDERILLKVFRIVSPIVVVGLLLDLLVDLPWQGYTYSLSGLEIEGNRDWVAGGIFQRLSGFQRSSSESAMILVTLIVFYLVNLIKLNKFKVRFYDVILLIASTLGVILTINKSAMLLLISLFILVTLLYLHRKIVASEKIVISILIKFFILVNFLYGVIPILISILNTNSAIINLKGFSNLAFGSFIDRMHRVWPEALNLIETQSHLIFGGGIGSIGVAQIYFDPLRYNPADSVYIYILVTFGLVGCLGVVLLVLLTMTVSINKKNTHYLLISLTVFLCYGATINVIETVGLSTLIGILIGLFFKNRKCKEETLVKEKVGY